MEVLPLVAGEALQSKMDRQERMNIERENRKEVEYNLHKPHFFPEDDIMARAQIAEEASP